MKKKKPEIERLLEEDGVKMKEDWEKGYEEQNKELDDLDDMIGHMAFED